MAKIIAWCFYGEPGNARLLDTDRLGASLWNLDGDTFLDRRSMKSMIETGGTGLDTNNVKLGVGVIVAGYVECAVRAAAGDMRGAYATLATLADPQERLMDLVPRASDDGPWVSAVLLAGEYNQLVTGAEFDQVDRVDLVNDIADNLRALDTTRAHVPPASENDWSDQLRHDRDMWKVNGVEKDLRLLLNAASELRPAPWQRIVSSTTSASTKSENGGCYIATAVYGSYESPSVLVLRRWRDRRLSRTASGRAFIQAYYAVSPRLVGTAGRSPRLGQAIRTVLDQLVRVLRHRGYGA